jgi:NitT/TauT family transport system ATP-binding protein
MHQPLPAGATTAGTRVSIRNVRRVYDNGVVALDGVSIDVAPGEFVAILGPSGSGKSTLLRLIAGLDQPQGGEVMTGVGTPANRPPLPPGEGRGEGVLESEVPLDTARPLTPTLSRRERGQESRPAVAYVFQDAHLLPWRNVVRNVELPLELAGVARAERRASAVRATEQVGLADAVGRYPAQLSGGMRMRASLARALVTDPALFLLDEPFAALDEITRHRLDEQLRGLWARRRMTVLFVTHSINEAVFLADRAIVLSRRPGRVLLDRPIDLPAERTEELRTTPEFARHAHALHVALRGEEP